MRDQATPAAGLRNRRSRAAARGTRRETRLEETNDYALASRPCCTDAEPAAVVTRRSEGCLPVPHMYSA